MPPAAAWPSTWASPGNLCWVEFLPVSLSRRSEESSPHWNPNCKGDTFGMRPPARHERNHTPRSFRATVRTIEQMITSTNADTFQERHQDRCRQGQRGHRLPGGASRATLRGGFSRLTLMSLEHSPHLLEEPSRSAFSSPRFKYTVVGCAVWHCRPTLAFGADGNPGGNEWDRRGRRTRGSCPGDRVGRHKPGSAVPLRQDPHCHEGASGSELLGSVHPGRSEYRCLCPQGM